MKNERKLEKGRKRMRGRRMRMIEEKKEKERRKD